MLLRHYVEQGASKSALARQLGVSRDTIHRWIRDGELDRDLDTSPVQYGPRRPVPTKPHAYKAISSLIVNAHAEVIVDGVNTGKVTPMNVSLADGDHVVIVRIPGSGWNPDTRTMTIVTGGEGRDLQRPGRRRRRPNHERDEKDDCDRDWCSH